MNEKNVNKITVIGTGAMGTALAKVLFDCGHTNIVMYGINKTELSELKKGTNTKYFPKTIKLPNLNTTTNLSKALDGASYILLAVPSMAFGSLVPKIIKNINSEALIINGSKGFYPGTEKSLHAGVIENVKKNKKIRGVVSIIGPSHAEEIVKCAPTIVASVAKQSALAEEVQELFSNSYFKLYVQTDVRGAEVGSAYKNVLAIASGITHGLGYGINSIAALLARGMAEMQIFNKCMKGKEKTLMGLTGLGDLIVTATSPLSRNFTLGTKLVKMNLKKALEGGTTVEGVVALEHIYKISLKKGLELPIVSYLYHVLFKNGKIDDFIKTLWARKFKAE